VLVDWIRRLVRDVKMREWRAVGWMLVLVGCKDDELVTKYEHHQLFCAEQC
jgi:hypothetical protein